MKDAGNITRDDTGNSFFTINENTYKLPRINWQLEEKFLIVMSGAGIDLMSGDGEKKSHDLNLFTEEGTVLRKTIIPWLFFESSHGQYTQLTDAYQQTHFTSIITVYEVLALAIEAITYFLSQAQPSSQGSSIQKQGQKSGSTRAISRPSQTSRA